MANTLAMLENAPCQPMNRACWSFESSVMYTPSVAMSCVAPLKAMTPISATA